LSPPTNIKSDAAGAPDGEPAQHGELAAAAIGVQPGSRSARRPDPGDAIRHGFVMIDAQGLVNFSNPRAMELLGLPPQFADGPFPLRQMLPQLDRIALEIGADGRSACTMGADGRAIEISIDPSPAGGFVMIIEDVTAERYRQDELQRAEAEYRSLFENAVYGIYRDTLDGMPLMANAALVRFNGYEDEKEYMTSVRASGANWYVDPTRPAQFRKLMETEGRVRDLVSEVYRHRTGERVWITENAWYGRDPLGRPLYIEGTILDATERVRGVAAIARQANTDPLTGSASRFFVMNKLNELTRDPTSSFALFSIDLDRFKEINDTMGHSAGDTVLKVATGRITAIAGADATVARLGGDEFAVILPGTGAAVNSDMTAKKIVGSLREPIDVAGQPVSISASIGIALYPAHASTVKELLTHVDLALYRVKSQGRNGAFMFDPELKANYLRRKAIERELREAILSDELELYYQPIVGAKDAAVYGYEALMRWNHPRRGFLPPSEFLPIAEEAGLMTELGNWAIRRACQQCAMLPAPLSVSVNVSPNQFRASGIVEVVQRALVETGLAPGRLMLEITETAILSSGKLAYGLIQAIMALEVKLALDDFGTGYSSLSYLQRYQFSKVKVDRSFVTGIEARPKDLAIIRAIVRLAADLGMDVVAEGIETEEQAAIIRNEECGFLQGYLYGKPRPFVDVLASEAVQKLRSLLPVRPLAAHGKTGIHQQLGVARPVVHKNL
jgi:diguanylate cyclase (GGDEF)-like protein/PAS domain S-box-containing protein